jgi:hypothetical protein
MEMLLTGPRQAFCVSPLLMSATLAHFSFLGLISAFFDSAQSAEVAMTCMFLGSSQIFG